MGSESGPQTDGVIQVHGTDNVVAALRDIPTGTRFHVNGIEVVCKHDVRRGHKIAVRRLLSGESVVKYGHSIGHATQTIEPGSWVHSHNLATNLSNIVEYSYSPVPTVLRQTSIPPRTFRGYRRASGRVGTRNEIWIINTVGCVNTSAEKIARRANELYRHPNVDGVFSFSHPFGCSQLGDDLANTRKVLAGLMNNPNAGAVLVLGLGCENNQLADLLKLTGAIHPNRIRSFNSQSVDDEIETGVQLIGELFDYIKLDRREECSLADLTVAMKCGGSDGLSGITANALVGRITDTLAAHNGRVLLSEVPEMFGAEQQLMNRAKDASVYERTVRMINNFKEYFLSHGQPVYENPSPGNKEGGLTTLEEKSLGAVQKGGTAPVSDVLDYGEQVKERGLSLLYAPGNDGVSSTAMVASGATLFLFTTGRGTPLGFPVPTLKISSNTTLFQNKQKWIDFNAGAIVDGATTMDELTEQLLDMIVAVASGVKMTKNELNGYREIAIWKEGVTL
ncbi:MAG: altronate dehydratase [Ignavibacteriae bacterium]|nr:altronate dehydratase [Ignavibacteriota bacterium]